MPKRAAELSGEVLKEHVFAICSTQDLSKLSIKGLIKAMEDRLELPPKALKQRKPEIQVFVQDFINKDGDESADVGSSSEEEEKQPPKKKAKTESKKKKPAKKETKKKSEGTEKKAESSCITRSGGKPPTRLKDVQSSLMTTAEFLRDAPTAEVEIFGTSICLAVHVYVPMLR